MNTLKFTSSGISQGYASYGSMSGSKITVFDSTVVDFSVIDNLGNLVFPPLQYSSQTGNTDVNLLGWTIEGEWTIQKNVVQRGKDACPAISESDMFSKIFALNTSGAYVSERKFQKPIPMRKTQDIPLIGKKFYASGFSQLKNNVSIVVTIPAFGTNRQYLETTRITKECLHHFQVVYDNQIILEAILDSNDFPSSEKNLGQIYYFPDNLSAYDENGTRKNYNWRCRISYKKIIEGSTEAWPNNLAWSEWSQYFTFKVNSPPNPPTELSVKS